MIENFSQTTVHNIAATAHDKYMQQLYSTQLLQIELAAENHRYSTSLKANDCPVELVTWLFLRGFLLYYIDVKEQEHRINAPDDYNDKIAKTVVIIW